MKIFFRSVLFCLLFIFSFSIGYFGAEMFVYESRIQECLVIDAKLQQFIYLQKELLDSKKAKSQKIFYPKSLRELGPVYWNFFGFSYEIDKEKFDYTPTMNRERYILEVSLPYGKKYTSARSFP